MEVGIPAANRATTQRGGDSRNQQGTDPEPVDASETNGTQWLKDDLPYEETSEGDPYCHNLQKPKFNFQSGDLDRLIDQVWSGQDTRHIYDRNRLQFHLQLLWFCDAGARRGALLKHGVPYKVNRPQQVRFILIN
jgi:hypothetical protein